MFAFLEHLCYNEKNNAKIKEKRFNYETNYPYPAKNI